DTAEGAYAKLKESGNFAIIPGKPEQSEFMIRILDKEDPMPPVESHKSLKEEEIAILRQWIKEGAEYEDPWAYVAPKKHPVPEVSKSDWPLNWIDHFVLARLEKKSLSPSPEADPVTLARRLSFDLTGLPPEPALVTDFQNDKISYEQLVETLIASPHFGERMAIYWLDLVRYADTVGYHGDQDHNISPYRDYVIKAFNDNTPFDQFTREQLAGDLLPNPTVWQKVASGYNRLLQTSHEGGIQAKEYNAIYAADRVRNVSEVWMGATVGCAQCHDHKYDPYTIKDHYTMAAFFADIHDKGYTGNTLPTIRPPEMVILSPELQPKADQLEAQMAELVPPPAQAEISRLEILRNKWTGQLKSLRDDKRKAALQARITDANKKIAALAPQEKRSAFYRLRKQYAELAKQGRRTMITVAEEPRTMRILPRGNWQDDSGEIVTPAIPEFMGQIELPEGQGRASRLDLANWLTDPVKGSGGLTARVMANRFWYLFYGRGISPSLSDFGGQGQAPVNPQLLDQLAVAFYESGWDVKALVRLLVSSRAYRQSSLATAEMLTRDPANALVDRQSRYRLPAELIRDNALAVSGLLVDEIGGDSAKPYQPEGYYRHLNFPPRKYEQHNDTRQWRRGLYVHWQRMFLHPMMKALDAPTREECTAERPRSNTPNASLVLLNDPTFVEAARNFAQRIVTEGGKSFEERIHFAYREALNRAPDTDEKAVFQKLLKDTLDHYSQDAAQADLVKKTGLSPAAKDVSSTELASWTAVARGLFNLYEFTYRN
ncbi:MAG: DUF1553 domain-containing protein, partial [Akkermansiaceae bacterium]